MQLPVLSHYIQVVESEFLYSTSSNTTAHLKNHNLNFILVKKCKPDFHMYRQTDRQTDKQTVLQHSSNTVYIHTRC